MSSTLQIDDTRNPDQKIQNIPFTASLVKLKDFLAPFIKDPTRAIFFADGIDKSDHTLKQILEYKRRLKTITVQIHFPAVGGYI